MACHRLTPRCRQYRRTTPYPRDEEASVVELNAIIADFTQQNSAIDSPMSSSVETSSSAQYIPETVQNLTSCGPSSKRTMPISRNVRGQIEVAPANWTAFALNEHSMTAEPKTFSQSLDLGLEYQISTCPADSAYEQFQSWQGIHWEDIGDMIPGADLRSWN